MGWQGAERFAEFEVVFEFRSVAGVGSVDVAGWFCAHAAVGVHVLADGPDEIGVGGEAVDEDGPGPLKCTFSVTN